MTVWLKSKTTDKFFLGSDITWREIPTPEAASVSSVLGYPAEVVNNDYIITARARVAENRAALVADIAAAVKQIK